MFLICKYTYGIKYSKIHTDIISILLDMFCKLGLAFLPYHVYCLQLDIRHQMTFPTRGQRACVGCSQLPSLFPQIHALPVFAAVSLRQAVCAVFHQGEAQEENGEWGEKQQFSFLPLSLPYTTGANCSKCFQISWEEYQIGKRNDNQKKSYLK